MESKSWNPKARRRADRGQPTARGQNTALGAVHCLDLMTDPNEAPLEDLLGVVVWDFSRVPQEPIISPSVQSSSLLFKP